MKGYIGMPPSDYLDDDGFFKTGDLGYYDEDKYFFIVERLKEVIVYDGYKVSKRLTSFVDYFKEIGSLFMDVYCYRTKKA